MNINTNKIETNLSFKTSTKKFLSSNFKVKTSINLPSIIGYISDDDNPSSYDSDHSFDFITSKVDALTDINLNEAEIPQEEEMTTASPLNAPKLSYMTKNTFINTQISLFNLD
jgi:hypothetical protein